ncbi:hypothetical protein B0H19DRAFT_1276713 [Mycena capillaripes]|nr:hypothetical protein B0H19DRAFT_1276713 [Mycena capillaripes]
MDPNNPHPAVDAPLESYDQSVTSSGYPPNFVTSSGYPSDSVTPSGYPENAYVQSSSDYPDNSIAAQHPPVDVAALMAANHELVERINQMRIGYNNEVKTEMQAFQAAVEDDFLAVQAQRDAAHAENQVLAAQIVATVARLERLEATQCTNSTAKPTAAKKPPATPKSAQKSSSNTPRRSKTPKDSGPDPSPKLQCLPPNTSCASANPPRPSPNPSGSSVNAARSSSSSASPSSSSSKDKSGNKAKGGSKNETKQGTQRKLAEHQMLKGDIDAEAQSFKTTFQMHIRFLSGCLESSHAPPSAALAVVQKFELRFEGLTVTELKRLGQIGQLVIKPSEVKLGVSVEDFTRTKNRIVWSSQITVDLTQSPYSMYNSAMRLFAIDTFRFLIAGTYYDFLHLDTRYVKDSALLLHLYDHFVHRYMFDKWKMELRTPGGNKINAEQNKRSQAHLRLHAARATYLKDAKIPKRLQLLFTAKATSDDESTAQGPRALAREERSQAADQVVRAVDRLIVQDLMGDGKTRAANNKSRRQAAPFGERNPGYFQEVPKAMPIQYYDPDWYNNRPPQARAKLEAKLIVVFPPGSKDFFSCRGDNTLSVEELTEKYGEAVFGDYDLDFGKADAEASGEGDDLDDADDEGEGDSIGSEDSDEEAESSDVGSDDPMSGNAAASGHKQDGDEDGTWAAQAEFAAAYDVPMDGLQRQIFGDSNDSDDSV